MTLGNYFLENKRDEVVSVLSNRYIKMIHDSLSPESILFWNEQQQDQTSNLWSYESEDDQKVRFTKTTL